MAYILMAYIVMADIAMAYRVMACVVMAAAIPKQALTERHAEAEAKLTATSDLAAQLGGRLKEKEEEYDSVLSQLNRCEQLRASAEVKAVLATEQCWPLSSVGLSAVLAF